MEPDSARAEIIPPRPVVFAGAGALAVATLARLPETTEGLSVHVSGPFGVVTAPKPPDGALFVSRSERLDEITLAGERGGDAPDLLLTTPHDELLGELIALVRWLRKGRPLLALRGSPRLEVAAYVLVDLTDPAAPDAGLALARLLREADPSLDITGLALTGRTARSQAQPGDPWYHTLCTMLARLQDASPFQRLYVLDGRDTNNTWLREPRDMERLGARFLLHHGLSPYRHHLRRRERTRISPREDFLHCCGSFACETLTSDRDIVERGVAARLAAEDLAEADQGMLDKKHAKGFPDLAKALHDKIAKICSTEGPQPGEQPSAPSERRAPDGEAPEDEAGGEGQGTPDKRVEAAVKSTIQDVCAQQPVQSLREFLRCFRPHLRQLNASNLLRRRMFGRYRIAGKLDEQERRTYRPTQRWLGISLADFSRGPYAPSIPEPLRLEVSRPASRTLFVVALFLVAMGLAGIALAANGGARHYAIGGGVLAILATMLMLLPCGWTEERCRVHTPTTPEPTARTDEASAAPDALPPAPTAGYRKTTDPVFLVLAALLLVGGAGAAASALSVRAWFAGASPLWWVVPAALAFAGLSVLLFCLLDRPEPPYMAVSHRLAPHMASPPGWQCLAITLALFAAAWVVLALRAPDPIPIDKGSWPELAGGLAAILLAAAVAGWPRIGRVKLLFVTPSLPTPPEGLRSVRAKETELSKQVRRIGPWVHRLLEETDDDEAQELTWPEPQRKGTLLDALAHDWDKRLADIFRSALHAERGVTLLERARSPEAWADCLVEELKKPTVGLANPGYLFALHEVRRWADQWSEAELTRQLPPDPQCFDNFVTRSISPRWPPTRDTGMARAEATVIAVSRDLWDIVAPLAEAGDGKYIILRVDWQKPQSLVVIRIVQGLAGGWLNFDPPPTKGTPTKPSATPRHESPREPAGEPPIEPRADASDEPAAEPPVEPRPEPSDEAGPEAD